MINPADFGSTLEYAVDQETVEQTFVINQEVVRKYLNKGIPIPPIYRCHPSCVDLWNNGKGPIDLYSRFFCNTKPTQKKVTTVGAMWLRMLRTAVYNAYQVHMIQSCEEFLQSKKCNTWKKLRRFRAKFRRKEGSSFKCFIGDLADAFEAAIFAAGGVSSKRKQRKNAVRRSERQRAKKQNEGHVYYRRESFLTEHELIQKRVTGVKDHQRRKLGDGAKRVYKRCVWCCDGKTTNPHYRRGFKTQFECNICEVALCNEQRAGHAKTCFDEFHTAKNPGKPCSFHGPINTTTTTTTTTVVRRVSSGDPPNENSNMLLNENNNISYCVVIGTTTPASEKSVNNENTRTVLKSTRSLSTAGKKRPSESTQPSLTLGPIDQNIPLTCKKNKSHKRK